MLQPHFISCRGVSGGRRQHARIQEFLSVLLVLSLFYSLKRGFNGFIAEKLYLYFTKDPEAVHYFPGGGGGGLSNFFPGGFQMLISLETHIRTCYFPGGVSGPSIPL